MLSLREDTENKTLLWLNPHPAGSEFLRPYMMSFEKESEDMVGIIMNTFVANTIFRTFTKFFRNAMLKT